MRAWLVLVTLGSMWWRMRGMRSWMFGCHVRGGRGEDVNDTERVEKERVLLELVRCMVSKLEAS
jgi:hypothetical protein